MRRSRFLRGQRRLAIALAIMTMMAMPVALPQAESEPRYTLDEAVAIVKDSVGGQVLRAVAREKNGRTIYEIRVLTNDGLVRNLIFDAEKGLEK
jgi:hypothetical protein